MRKTAFILLITLVTVVGCTKIPASEETGIKPGEYEGQMKTEELKSENDKLKSELELTKEQLKKLEEDLTELTTNNNVSTKKLTEAESIIMMFQDTKIPKFTIEKADKNNIVNYLTEKSNFLNNSYKNIVIIPLNSIENKVMFYTSGYGENHNQIFLWDTAKTEPVMIDGANFNENGNWKWLLQDKYLLLSSTDNTNKVLDMSTLKVSNAFKGINETMYFFKETTSVLMKRNAASAESPFIVYDFLTGDQKEVLLDNKSKFNNFKVDENNNEIIFTGIYEENDISYAVEASLKIDKIKQKYITKTATTSSTN